MYIAGEFFFFFSHFWRLKPFEVTSSISFLIRLFGEISPVKKGAVCCLLSACGPLT
jgi:hypothetical protein